jgi:hypothetical protein
MPFDEFGFLGSQINDVSIQIYESNRDIFDLCHDLNHFAHKVKFEFSIESNNVQRVIAATLFIKVLHGFQSAVVLFKYGLTSDGKVIARSIMETMFTLKAICDNDDAVSEYIKSDNAKREKLLNVILNEPDQDIFSAVKSEINPEFIDSLKRRNRDEKVRDISAQEWAEKAGLKSHYQTAYRILNDEVHTTPRSLQQYVNEDDNGLLTLECGPSTDDLRPTLITALITLIISLDSLCTMFSVNHRDELNQFETRIKVKA